MYIPTEAHYCIISHTRTILIHDAFMWLRMNVWVDVYMYICAFIWLYICIYIYISFTHVNITHMHESFHTHNASYRAHYVMCNMSKSSHTLEWIISRTWVVNINHHHHYNTTLYQAHVFLHAHTHTHMHACVRAHACTHACTHARTLARTLARSLARTHARKLLLVIRKYTMKGETCMYANLCLTLFCSLYCCLKWCPWFPFKHRIYVRTENTKR